MKSLVVFFDLAILFVCLWLSQSALYSLKVVSMGAYHLYIVFGAYFIASLFCSSWVTNRMVSNAAVASRAVRFVVTHFVLSTALAALAQYWLGGLGWIAMFWGLALGLILLSRMLLRALQVVLWQMDIDLQPVLLVGDFTQCEGFSAWIKKSESGYICKGVFAQEQQLSGKDRAIWKGEISDAAAYIEENAFHGSLLCLDSQLTAEQNAQLFTLCAKRHIHYHVLPTHLSSMERNFELKTLKATPLLTPIASPLNSTWAQLIKRVADIAISTALLATVFPFVYCAMLICYKKQCQGSILALHTFHGKKGKPFKALLFNTPQPSRLAQMPLLLSVLIGKLSLAGPSYYKCGAIESYAQQTNNHNLLAIAKPGLSGCNGTANNPSADIAYLYNWSIWLDIKLIIGALLGLH